MDLEWSGCYRIKGVEGGNKNYYCNIEDIIKSQILNLKAQKCYIRSKSTNTKILREN